MTISTVSVLIAGAAAAVVVVVVVVGDGSVETMSSPVGSRYGIGGCI